MTRRRSKRELERAVEELEAERNAGDVTLTDLLLDDDPDGDIDDAGDVSFQYTVVMDRERAEREGREILGPADAPGDAVRVGDADT